LARKYAIVVLCSRLYARISLDTMRQLAYSSAHPGGKTSRHAPGLAVTIAAAACKHHTLQSKMSAADERLACIMY
jgi:hypothetical protein